jgi:hypothetical protein
LLPVTVVPFLPIVSRQTTLPRPGAHGNVSRAGWIWFVAKKFTP